MNLIFLEMSAWSLLNILCIIWCTLNALSSIFIRNKLYSINNWVPNKESVILDGLFLASLALSIFFGLCIAVYSILNKIELFFSILNLFITIIIMGLVTGKLFFVGKYIRYPQVKRSVGQKKVYQTGRNNSEIIITAGGDISFDRRLESPQIVRHDKYLAAIPVMLSWMTRKPALPIPRLNLPSGDNSMPIKGPIQMDAEVTIEPNFEESNDFFYPFNYLKELYKSSDINFVNLEGPLAESKRYEAHRIASDPGYANAMKKAGINVVNIANNHCFDADESGLLETLDSLEEVRIRYTGVNRNRHSARKATITEVDGFKIGWLGYTQKMARVTLDYAVAREDRVGCLPLDPYIIKDDIENAKKDADFVIVTPHWGVENTHKTSKIITNFGHWLIDAGADAVIGHGPHLYQAVEIYKNCPIFYSLGTLIFGIWFKSWTNNILARIRIQNGKIHCLEIIPVSGIKRELFQPKQLIGQEANQVLKHFSKLSRTFGTEVRINDNTGIIPI